MYVEKLLSLEDILIIIIYILFNNYLIISVASKHISIFQTI